MTILHRRSTRTRTLSLLPLTLLFLHSLFSHISNDAVLASETPTSAATATTATPPIPQRIIITPSPPPPSAPVLFGIGIGSRVIRGPSWEYGEQDGGAGRAGSVIELRRWKAPYNISLGSLTGVRVLWDTGKINTYRWAEAPPSSKENREKTGTHSKQTTTTTTEDQQQEKKTPIPPLIRDLLVIGWREPSISMQNIPSRQEEKAEYVRNQMLPDTTTRLLMRIYDALGGAGWKAAKGWREYSHYISAQSHLQQQHQQNMQNQNNKNMVTRKNNNNSSSSATPPPFPSISTTFKPSNPCTDSWEGVTCKDGQVIGLDLSNNGLTLGGGGGGGETSSSIVTSPPTQRVSSSSSRSLQKRRLFPIELWQLLAQPQFISLNLAYNQGLQGVQLDDDDNIEDDTIKDITNPQTKGVKKNKKMMKGQHQDKKGTKRQELNLCSSRSNIKYLDLSAIGLTGTLPACMAELSSLETLFLHSNKLHGNIPEEWGGPHSTLPQTLRVLQLHGNDDLEGDSVPQRLLHEAPQLLGHFSLPSHMRHHLTRQRN